jgi:WD40 repeat protein
MDSTVRIWDAVTGTELQTLRGHSDGVWCVAFSSVGNNVVSGSRDKTVRFWDALTGTELHTFHGHSHKVHSVAFSPDDACVLSGSSDNTVRIWDAIARTKQQTISGHSGQVNSVAFSPNGKYVVSESTDSTVRTWDAFTGTELCTLQGHSGSVNSVVFSPDGRLLASGSDHSTVYIWDAVTGTLLKTLQGQAYSWVRSVAFSPDSTRIISHTISSLGDKLWLWDTSSGDLLDTKEEGFRDPSLIATFLTPLQSTIATNESQGSSALNMAAHIFSLDPDDGWFHCETHNQRICWIPVDCRSCSFSRSPDNFRLAFGLENGQVVFFDLTGIKSHCRSH